MKAKANKAGTTKDSSIELPEELQEFSSHMMNHFGIVLSTDKYEINAYVPEMTTDTELGKLIITGMRVVITRVVKK
jgi:hypothetical protein